MPPRRSAPPSQSPAADLIAGFCRFSYLGRSDFSALKKREMSPEDWQDRARLLYDPDRLAARFAAFQQVCLPSILAQDDPRFVFVIITSPELPEPWMTRLRDLCGQSLNLHLEVVADRDLGRGIAPLLQDMTAMAGRNLIQFRLDDDDALALGAVARLRRLADRMADLPQFGISMAHGVSVALYPDRPVTPFLHDLPFLGAALAVRFAKPDRTVFSIGHFAVQRVMTHILDRGPPAVLLLKWPSDSRPLDLDKLPPYLRTLTGEDFRAELQLRFPWLLDVDFAALQDAAAEAHPALIAPAAEGNHAPR